MALHGALAFVTNSSVKDVLLEASINFANGADNTIVAGVSGQGIYVYKYFLVVSNALTLTFKDGSTGLTGPISLAANEAMVFTFDTRPWYSTTLGNDFIINASNGSQVSGRVYYLQL